MVILRDVTEDRQRIDELQGFARAAAHDLRQPLTAIRVWADTLRTELGGPIGEAWDEAARRAHLEAGEEALDRIDTATERMDHFLRDLLAYAVDRGGRAAPELLDVGELADDVVAGRLATHSGPPAQVRVHAPHRVYADPALTRRLLDNLVGNALKYTRPGEPARVAVTTARAGEWVLLRVDDHGIGLPAGQERLVFDEFHRVPAHAKAYPGTGLGLALCRRIAERHGGTIRAVRRPQGGTRFEVRLPAGSRKPSRPSTAWLGAGADGMTGPGTTPGAPPWVPEPAPQEPVRRAAAGPDDPAARAPAGPSEECEVAPAIPVPRRRGRFGRSARRRRLRR